MTRVRSVLLEIPLAALVAWWQRDEMRLAAALAYYTVLSIAPLLALLLGASAALFGEKAARGGIVGQLTMLTGPHAAGAIQDLVATVHLDRAAPGGLSTLLLILGTTAAFGETQVAFNFIWNVKPRPRGVLWPLVRARLLSFGLVLCMGAMLAGSLLFSALLGAAEAEMDLGFTWPRALPTHLTDLVLSFLVVTVLLTLVFRTLPDVQLRLSDVLPGALFTSMLFALGKHLIGVYLARADLGSSFGAAGSFVALLVFIYYAAGILYLGAEYTRVYTERSGSRVAVAAHAVPARGTSTAVTPDATAAAAAAAVRDGSP